MRFLTLTVIALALGLPARLPAAPRTAVSVSENKTTCTLANGLVTARIDKQSGDLLSLEYKNLEMLNAKPGRPGGYWSHNAARGRPITRITIDPKKNGGERGEVAITGISGGEKMGSGPGGGVIADIEIRYALGRGDAGIYTYSILTHPTNYPATSVGEARFCLKLNDAMFDWMTVDSNRNMEMISAYDWNHGTPMNSKEARRMNTGILKGQVEHKYDYAANQFDVRAWGWSSSEKNVGLWLVNPSVEYLSGGPTKFELSAHRDATFNTNALRAPAPPTLLNYWRSSHYGGSLCNIAATDAWIKVVGPFLIYCNATGDHDALWRDARARLDRETRAWPFDWVNGVDYPHKNDRATVSGKIVLDDPLAPDVKMKNLLVGLTAPDYAPAVLPRAPRPERAKRNEKSDDGGSGFGLAGGGDDEAAMTNQNIFPGGATNENTSTPASNRPPDNRSAPNRRGGGGGLPRLVDWQTDAKNYEFWVRANDDGTFTLPNVRAGIYSLHAIADGVLGDLTVTNIVVAPGKNLPLGNLDWRPVRFGKQLWDIGIPNRTGAEFFKGDDYFHWGWYLQYPKLFPYDVKYVIGQSDYRRDWFFEQVPYNENSNNVTGRGNGSMTTWTIRFNLPAAPHGRATLRLPICGVGARSLTVYLNDRVIGSITNLTYNAAINRDGIGGYWTEHDLAFDAARMKAGTNLLELSLPAGGLTSGIIYDYLRLELDENAPPPQ
jgi:rhamnogalacturonan endolyase